MMKSHTVRKMIAVAVLTALFLLGCATTEPIWFVATPGYVEARITTSENAIRQEYELEIARLEHELNTQRALSEELAALSQTIAAIETSNRELLGLRDELEDRLSEVPRETIRQIIEVFQRFLDESPLP